MESVDVSTVLNLTINYKCLFQSTQINISSRWNGSTYQGKQVSSWPGNTQIEQGLKWSHQLPFYRFLQHLCLLIKTFFSLLLPLKAEKHPKHQDLCYDCSSMSCSLWTTKEPHFLTLTHLWDTKHLPNPVCHGRGYHLAFSQHWHLGDELQTTEVNVVFISDMCPWGLTVRARGLTVRGAKVRSSVQKSHYPRLGTKILPLAHHTEQIPLFQSMFLTLFLFIGYGH